MDQYGKRQYGKNFKEMSLSFRFELFDLTLDKVTWKARAVLEVTREGTSSGKEFASSIISRLRSDGVLKGCR